MQVVCTGVPISTNSVPGRRNILSIKRLPLNKLRPSSSSSVLRCSRSISRIAKRTIFHSCFSNSSKHFRSHETHISDSFHAVRWRFPSGSDNLYTVSRSWYHYSNQVDINEAYPTTPAYINQQTKDEDFDVFEMNTCSVLFVSCAVKAQLLILLKGCYSSCHRVLELELPQVNHIYLIRGEQLQKNFRSRTATSQFRSHTQRRHIRSPNLVPKLRRGCFRGFHSLIKHINTNYSYHFSKRGDKATIVAKLIG
jgi:hypothetical protein